MTINELKSKQARKVLLTHTPKKLIGFECVLIKDVNYNDLRSAICVIVDMETEGDYSVLYKVANRCKETYYRISGRRAVTKFIPDVYNPDLEQFMRNKLKKELTFTDVLKWFNRNKFRYADSAIFIEEFLNAINETHSDLQTEYRNACIAVGYDPKPFTLKETDIDDFNLRLAYVYDDKENMQYAGNTIRGYYNYKDEYCEEESPIYTKADRRLTSYSSKCRQSYNIASPEDVINVLALLYYLDDEMLAPDVYQCECGHYNRYRTAQVQQDSNTGYWKAYPDTEVCCPCCGELKRNR